MANNIPGVGTVLQVKISSSFTTIPLVTKVEGPDREVGERKLTDISSSSQKSRPGLPDFGTVKVTFWYDPNNSVHQTLMSRTTAPTQTLDEFKKIYVDGLTTPAFQDFKGWVKSCKETGIEEDKDVEMEIEIKVTDLLTDTAGVP